MRLVSLDGLLACPDCRQPLMIRRGDEQQGVLGHVHGACMARYPVIDGIPRLLRGNARVRLVERHRSWFIDAEWIVEFPDLEVKTADRKIELRIVDRFDREWREFSSMNPEERSRLFEEYFDIVPAAAYASGSLVLDAGCGSGRWACELSRRGASVVAMDLGASVEIAARNTAAEDGVVCVQADVVDTPFLPGTFDFVCSLGVLHHVTQTELALQAIVRTLRPGGLILLYLYYALDGRPGWYRAIFRLTDILRRALSAAPQPITRTITSIVALFVYLPLARLSALLHGIGLHKIGDEVPLSFYRELSFRTMRNDSLDRFGTAIEKRYTRAGVVRLMTDAGLQEIVVSEHPPYWRAVGRLSTSGGTRRRAHP